MLRKMLLMDAPTKIARHGCPAHPPRHSSHLRVAGDVLEPAEPSLPACCARAACALMRKKAEICKWLYTTTRVALSHPNSLCSAPTLFLRAGGGDLERRFFDGVNSEELRPRLRLRLRLRRRSTLSCL